MPSLTLKALLSDHSLLFHHVVACESPSSRKRPALVATTFLNSQGGRLRELRLCILPKFSRWEPQFFQCSSKHDLHIATEFLVNIRELVLLFECYNSLIKRTSQTKIYCIRLVHDASLALITFHSETKNKANTIVLIVHLKQQFMHFWPLQNIRRAVVSQLRKRLFSPIRTSLSCYSFFLLFCNLNTLFQFCTHKISY